MIPQRVFLGPGSPSPFSASTRLEFGVAREGNVHIDVFDVSGRRLRGLLSERLRPGRYVATWHGEDDQGRQVAAGVYVIRMIGGGEAAARRLVRLK
jgi:flagellar hook assembly protein FlgD